MDDFEKYRADAIAAVRYLKNAGFPESYLAEIHQNGKETYKRFFNHWEDKVNTIRLANIPFACRVIFIAEQHKATGKSFLS